MSPETTSAKTSSPVPTFSTLEPTFSNLLQLPTLKPSVYGSVMTSQSSYPPPLSRLLIIVHCFLSFIICNMDRINLSVAIIPMSNSFGWSSSTKGLVQSVFFGGYMTTQILGGVWADAYGGRLVLAAGVFMWSLCTMITPAAAHVSFPLLLAIRIVMGVGEGVAMPAMNALVVKVVPLQERGRALSFIYSGMYAGSIIGLAVSPAIILHMGWPVVFYLFGAIGLVWVVLFIVTTSSEGKPYQAVPDEEAVEHGERAQEVVVKPTVMEMLSRRCVWAIIVAHFCCTWGYFVLLSWLPTYLYSHFNLDVKQSALLSALPWACMFVFANVGGAIADWLIRRGASTTFTRKLMQTIGFVGPAIFLAVLCTAQNAAEAMAYVSAGLALASFSQSGVYANHQDIGPGIAGTLLGISNTFASLPGLIGVYVSGVVLDWTGKWEAVFAMAIAFYALGVVVYNALGTAERVW